MHVVKLLAAATCLASLIACGGGEPEGTGGTPALGTSDIGSIGGTPIPESLYRRLALNMLQKPVDDMTEDERAAVTDQLLALILVSRQGSAEGLDSELNIAAELELRRMQHLASVTVARHLERNPPSEAELRALYEERIQNLSGTEYKARHILVETEQEAIDVIALLDMGRPFAELAAERSTGPTGPNGGDLGWFTPDRMVAPFANAVRGMEVGAYSKTPVRTEFGWHVILLEDSRDQQPPGIDSMRADLVAAAREQKIQQYVRNLRENADVVLK